MEPTAKQTDTLNQLTRSNEIEWQPLTEPGSSGVSFKVLRFDGATRRAPSILLKFAAGGTFPAHNHPGGEEVFVIEGDLTLANDHLTTGDYLYTAPNGKHAARSEQGCVVLVIRPEEVEILRTSE